MRPMPGAPGSRRTTRPPVFWAMTSPRPVPLITSAAWATARRLVGRQAEIEVGIQGIGAPQGSRAAGPKACSEGHLQLRLHPDGLFRQLLHHESGNGSLGHCTIENDFRILDLRGGFYDSSSAQGEAEAAAYGAGAQRVVSALGCKKAGDMRGHPGPVCAGFAFFAGFIKLIRPPPGRR